MVFNNERGKQNNMDTQLFNRFAPVIRSLTDNELADATSLNTKFRLAQDGPVEICYAPFEYINGEAKIVIVGITPGRTQMVNALREAREQLKTGADASTALRAAKLTGAFSGSMRPNLIALLDGIGLHTWLRIATCGDLFGSGAEARLVQTASVLRNPVFINGENYNGTPNMTRHPLLREQLLTQFGADVQSLPNALFVPLGDKVSEALHFLADEGRLDRARILDGLPHPSGANAERIAYFLRRKERSALSAKTDPEKLDAARQSLIKRVLAYS
ncbi:MAG: hypothetical protein ACXWIT_08205 [Burkholderiales bacterium]